ncbi:P-loop containing nucleoside triphosphate hydrolase protein, partial [Mycena amicta]
METPKGTSSQRKQATKASRPLTGTLKSSRTPLTDTDVRHIGEMCQKEWGWDTRLKDGQIKAIQAQLLGKDVLVHAATGYGKTCIAAGPFAHPKSKGLVSMMVSPLIALQEEMVETFTNEFKLSAVAVNSSHGGCSNEHNPPDHFVFLNILQKIVSGAFQIILISPELLLSKVFIDKVLRNTTFTRKLLSVVVDEAHVVSHWGTDFRKLYGALGLVRAFLPRTASVVAMSATLSTRVRSDVLSKLQFGKNFVDIDVGNDRPNVSLVVRSFQHPINTYRDLDFIIPSNTQRAEDIPLTWVYADSIAAGTEIADHLTALLPAELRKVGLIRPYNAAYSKEYRAEAMRLVREGKIRVLICTDAAGMGCNIPGIEVIVQWKLPSSLSAFLQRAGRAARQYGRQGLAVLIVERSAYEKDLWAKDEEGETSKKPKKKGGKKKTPTNKTREQLLEYAGMRGLSRGSTAKTDTCSTKEQPPVQRDAEDENLLVLVQTTVCRRRVVTEVYENKNVVAPTGPCCDLCDPSLLDRTRPGTFQTARRRAGVSKGIPSVFVQTRLNEWRTYIKKRDFPGALWSVEGLLQRETMELLSAVGPIRDRAQLDRTLAGQWKWTEKYGDELLAFLKSFQMPPYVAKSKK